MTEHALITLAEAPAYLRAQGVVAPDEPLTVAELGGGVSSNVILAETSDRRLILKQALPKLRVQKDWPSRPDRSSVEVAALRAVAAWTPPNAIPRVVAVDTARHAFVMTAAPADAVNWKGELLAGRVDRATASRAGAILAAIHLGSARDHAVAARFDDREFFVTLRVDPYLWEARRVHPDLADPIGEIVDAVMATRRALTHGDYSPKNMLTHGDQLLILDFEVAHWGDPAFDLAFCLNHFLLKAVFKAPAMQPYFDLAMAFWAAYAPALTLEPASTLLPRTLALQAGLMLARIDGKSPAEYIVDPGMQARVRAISRRLLAARPVELAETVAMVRAGIASH